MGEPARPGLLEHEGDAGVLTDLGVDKADVEANVLAALAQVVANRPQ